MKIVAALLLCLVVSVNAMADMKAPNNLIVCQTEAYLEELVIAIQNSDEHQIGFLFKHKYCLEVKPGIKISHAGTNGNTVKIRAYTEKGSAIFYTDMVLLTLIGKD